MGIISYAQNFEDVILWRVFKDVKDGFYVDVGANDPVADSVTNLFYENGWSGVNIEPNRQFFAKLQAERPRDINIFAAATNFNGEISFFEFDDTGLSTTEESLSLDHDKRGYKSLQVRVEALTLATIFQRHVSGDVHFLKIDVEGGTRSVLQGINFAEKRPWVILCESIKPFSRDEDYDQWEYIILDNSYKFVYEDGVNRFYLAKERLELIDCFRFPPNIFDFFMRYSPPSPLLAEHQAEQERLRAALAAQVESIAASQQFADEARAEAADVRRENAILQAGVEERSERIVMLETRVAELTHGFVALEARVAECAAQAQAMDAHVAALEREKANLEATVAHLTAEAQAVRTYAQDLERERAVQAQALAAVEARAQAAEARLEQETSALRASLDLCAQATANTAQLMREKSGVETTLARTQERLQAAQSRIEDLDQIRQGLQANLAEQTEQARMNGGRAEHLETVLRRVAASPSWRLTAPLRALNRGGKGGNSA